MGFKCGIIGLPNVGKSTLFKALTKIQVNVANFPFCTIDPNVGNVNVPEQRLYNIAEIIAPQKIIHSAMQFVDIAGLVKGAYQGEGLGNQFLAHIRQMDALAQVVRCFDNQDIVHVSDNIDPLDDIAVINLELALADLQLVEKILPRIEKEARAKVAEAKALYPVLVQVKEWLDEGLAVRTQWCASHYSKEQIHLFKQLNLLTAKPMLYIANVGEKQNNQHYVQKVCHYAAQEQSQALEICNQFEAELSELTVSEQRELLASDTVNIGLHRLIKQGYALLNLHTYFTAGKKEVRAWAIQKGECAPQAAGKIHSDFERGFICAEVVGYEDFMQYNGLVAAKEAGKLLSHGRDYIVQDGDIIHFRFNV